MIAHLFCFQTLGDAILLDESRAGGPFVVYSDIHRKSTNANSNRNRRKMLVFKKISHKFATKLLILGTIIATIKAFRVSPN